MRINELFTSGAVPWQWSHNDSDQARATFAVDGAQYMFYAYSTDDNDKEWEIEFSLATNNARRYSITGSGNAPMVMSTIVDLIRTLMTDRPAIQSLGFSADEPSRNSLYAKMIRRLLPSWMVEKSPDGLHFTVTKPVTENREYQMQLNELFTTGAVPWEWTYATNYSGRATFTVAGNQYIFSASSVDVDDTDWEIEFSLVTDDGRSWRIAKTGNAPTVMSTVVDIMRALLVKNPNIQSLGFSADEPSRNSLYAKMIQRLLPSWVVEKSPDGLRFAVTKPVTESKAYQIQLNELFTSGAVPWQWKLNSESDVIATFLVDKEQYSFSAHTISPGSLDWEILFSATDRGIDRFSITGSGNAAAVMATVVDIMRDFLKKHPATTSIRFAASENSRRKLYTKMISRLLPTWSLTKSTSGRFFTVTRPNTNN